MCVRFSGNSKYIGPLAQLVRAPPCHGGGHRFKSVVGRYGVLAQLGEHLPYKQRVTGSSPVGPINYIFGRIPEWPKGADCKSVVTDFGGSNPPPPILIIAGWSSLEARRAHNPEVIGSNPIPATRDIKDLFTCPDSSVGRAEH